MSLTIVAQMPVDGMDFVLYLNGLMRAVFHTIPAKDTFRNGIQNIRMLVDAFGVGAPGTAEGAALYENQCSAAGAVVHRKPLDIENIAFNRRISR